MTTVDRLQSLHQRFDEVVCPLPALCVCMCALSLDVGSRRWLPGGPHAHADIRYGYRARRRKLTIVRRIVNALSRHIFQTF